MPQFKAAMSAGPLSGPERYVMKAIESKGDHVWCTAPEDLAELAILTIDPTIDNPERYFPDETMDAETTIVMRTDRTGSWMDEETYKLKTVRWALNRLAGKGRIAMFKMHGRNYYGSFGAYELLQNEVRFLNSEELDRLAFDATGDPESSTPSQSNPARNEDPLPF